MAGTLISSLFVLCLWLAASSSATARPAQDALASQSHAEGSVEVHLVVTVPAETPSDADVYLAGSVPSVGNWKADGVKLARQVDGTFTATLTVEAGVTLEYKFTRGSWDTVEKSSDGGEVSNHAITIATNTLAKVTVARWGEKVTMKSTVTGTLELLEIDSAALKSKRTIRVWLPAGYDARGTTTYDVLYLHDGQNCFDRATSAFGHEWEIDESMSKLIEAKAIRPIIVVGIDNGGAQRIDEMTFDADPKRGGGKAEAYSAFVLDEVKPFIEKTFRVSVGREHAFLGGSSLGGLVSLEIARRHPDIFAGVIAMSPSLWWNDASLTRAIEHDAMEHDAAALQQTRVWLDMGTRETGDAGATAENLNNVLAAKRLDNALRAAGVEHRLEIVEDAQHNEDAWAKRFPDAIRFLLGSR